MWRKRPAVTLLLTAVVVIPIATHAALALLVHRWLDSSLPRSGEARIAVSHGGVSVGPFASWVTLHDPRLTLAGREQPIVSASRLRLERDSWLLGWLLSGAFDLTLHAIGLRHDRGWLEQQGASSEQLALVRILGLDDGTAEVTIRATHDPVTNAAAARVGYRNGASPRAAMSWRAGDVQWRDIAGIGQLRMPRIAVESQETQYSSEAVAERVRAAASQARLTESTVLRLLPAPLRLDLATERLRREGIRVQRLHAEPMLSGLVAEGVAPETRAGEAPWTLERVTLRRLIVGRAGGKAIPERLRLDIAAANLSAGLLPGEGAELLRQAGHERVALDLRADYRHDPASGALELAPLTLANSELGELQGRLRLGQIDARSLVDQPQTAFIGATIETLDLTYTDRGLAASLVEALAQRRQASVSDANRWLRLVARSRLRPLLGGRQDAVLPAIDEFLRRPETLTVATQTDDAVPVRLLIGSAMAGRYSDIAERLALTAKANVEPD